jgi:S-adenosylmethionine/arginine decarboxylase-like enzyme
VAIDIFTCGEMQPQVAVDIMRKDFRAKEATVKVLVRGQLERG